MKKHRHLLKKSIIIFIAIIFSVNSFAAVVNNSDGNAFLTKGAFEDMKKDFDDKIDKYNSSLDSKIDGAIAAYLSGLIRRDDEIKHKTGIYTLPLDMYMNFDEVDAQGFSHWGVDSNWRVFIGYYSAYLSENALIKGPRDASDNPWQPKQWYNLTRDAQGNYICDTGYKKVEDTLSYVVWGLSDTGLNGDNAKTLNPTHAYLFAAITDRTVDTGSIKWYLNERPLPNGCIETGDYKWNTTNTEAPTVNGFTTVKDDENAMNYFLTYDSGRKLIGQSGVSWWSGFHSVLHSSQASTQQTSIVNTITNNENDYVHVLYDNGVWYTIRDDVLYGKGSLGSRQTDVANLGNYRTAERSIDSPRSIWAFAVPYFAIAREGHATSTKDERVDFTDYTNTSLIRATHVSQKYNGVGENGTDLTLKISDGIYLCTPDKLCDIKIKLEIDSTDLDAGDRPYILFNTRGINETALNPNLATQGFKRIEGGDEVAVVYGDYAKYISNGENELTIKECEKGKPIVMKILWNQASKKKVTLSNAVKMTVNTENY